MKHPPESRNRYNDIILKIESKTPHQRFSGKFFLYVDEPSPSRKLYNDLIEKKKNHNTQQNSPFLIHMIELIITNQNNNQK